MSNEILDRVKIICHTYKIQPVRQKGQNFLIDQAVLKKIVEAAELGKDDIVLEVGPGLGILTEELVKKAKKVISVELDQKFFEFLKTKFSGVNNLELINGDILELGIRNYELGIRYKIVANLPYNITSRFLKKFLTAEHKPAAMTLLVQKEVAQRICARPGQMSLLSVSVQLYGQPEIVAIVGRDNFWPKPEVDSAILKISAIKNQPALAEFLAGITEETFWQLVRIGFSSRRKQLQNNLTSGLKIPSVEVKNLLKKANFNPQIRAQNLSVRDWITLARKLNF